MFRNLFNDFEPKVEEEVKSCCGHKKKKAELSHFEKIKAGLRYGFVDLIDDLSMWLTIGIFVGALVGFIVPDDFFIGLGPFWSRFAILAIGVPLYICASATTPIAASLILKGMSPGTALILLLVGPATNASNIMVLQKYIGKKGVMINIAAIVLVALGMSYITDFFYSNWNLPMNWKIEAHQHEHHSVLTILIGVVFSALLVKGVIKEEILPRLKKKEGGCCAH